MLRGCDTLSQGWRLGPQLGMVARVGLSQIKGQGLGRVGRRCWLLPVVTDSGLSLRGPEVASEQLLPQNNCPEWGRAPLPLWG